MTWQMRHGCAGRWLVGLLLALGLQAKAENPDAEAAGARMKKDVTFLASDECGEGPGSHDQGDRAGGRLHCRAKLKSLGAQAGRRRRDLFPTFPHARLG